MVQINISHSFYSGLRIAPGGTNGHFTLYIAPVSYPSFIESEILFSVKWIHTRFFFFFFSEHTTTPRRIIFDILHYPPVGAKERY